MKKNTMKINFIMNSTGDAHANKRIREFIDAGYEVGVFGFERDCNTRFGNNVTVIGKFSNKSSYKARISIYFKGLRKLFNSYPKDGSIWYYQGLDVAMFATMLNPNKHYIYEECDLVHANLKNQYARSLLERMDKHIIKKSLKTVLTSEGFVEYHYGADKNISDNIVVIPNKLLPCVADIKRLERQPFNKARIRFAFVGGLRYRALVSLADVITKRFPNHEFHFYGFVSSNIDEKELPRRENIFYHGAYKSPDDLQQIYKNVDILVSTYDTASDNVKYAEPNKFYEAVYFSCPIVVSRDTFLARKTEAMGIGYAVNAFDEEDIMRLVGNIENSYYDKVAAIAKIGEDYALETDVVTKIMDIRQGTCA